MQHSGHPDAAPTSRGLASGEKIFGRFVLVRPLGRGGMGVVWLARDEVLEVAVALKFLPDAVRWDPAALTALRREVRRSLELTHPGIVRVHDIHEDAGSAAIAMEYLAGGSLHQLRGTRTPPVLSCAEIAGWLPGLCAGLDHAHARGVVHRDLKPANLLVADDGLVKVSDFGIAQPLFETALRISQWAPSGTLAYMSPQQQFGEPADKADDIYALGATLYELLTGKPPFYSGNLAAQIERRQPDSMTNRRRQLGVNGEPIPAQWEKTIAACLAKRAEDRPASASAVAASLLAAEPSRNRHRSSVTYYITNPFARSGLRRPLLLGALALTLGLVAWRLWPGNAAPSAEGGSSRAAPAHPSDAIRALAAWNLDGNGREGSGRDWELTGAKTIPTTDRWGRIDRAMFFNGSAGLELPAPAELRWAGSQPFTAALWVKPAGQSVDGSNLIRLRSTRVGDPVWELGLSAQGARFFVGKVQVDDGTEFFADSPIALNAWSHVAAVSDGQRLALYVNGRSVGQSDLHPSKPGNMPTAATLEVGFANRLDPDRFFGAMDEIRLWRRALAPAEIMALADSAPEPRWTLSQGSYAETADLPAAIAREFGAEARLADWTQLVRWHRDDTRAWLEELGNAVGGATLFVQHQGKRFIDAKRHYFLTRFDGMKPAYYLAHEELGGMTLALGSWYGLNNRALVELPFVPPRSEQLPAKAGAVLREFAPDFQASGIALRWSREFSRGQRPAAEARLSLRDGRQLRAVCQSNDGETFALALGEVIRPAIAREVGATYDRLEFNLVLRGGRLEFRAVSGVGGNLLFRETVDLPGVAPADLASLTVPGVDSAELIIEE